MAEPLLGVILATSSSRGDHIVFRWPNNPKLFKRYSKVKYYTEARPSHSSRTHIDDELDPVRQKAKWDRHDEDDDDHANTNSDDGRQSDTPSSSDVEDSDGTVADEDDTRSVRDRAETVASHGRSKSGATPSASRSKSKSRRPLLGMEEASASARSTDRQTGAHKDTAETHDRAPDSDAGTSKELSPEEKARREERAARAYKTYLGYDIEILASILNPRPELSHQKFELVIDDLAFLGHPVSESKSGVWGDEDDHADVLDDKAAAHTQQRGRSGLRKEIRPYDLPDGRDASNDDDDADVSAIKGAKSRNTSLTRTEQTNDTSASRSKAPLTQFHLVLVLDRPDPSANMFGMDLSSWLQLFYDNIVFKITSALFAEQCSSDYVGRETEKLLALRERCMDDGQAYAAYAAQCLGISSLARCIRDLHKSISTSSDAFLTINERIEVHLQLPPILQDPSNLHKIVDIETELDPKDPIFQAGGGFAGLGKEDAQADGTGGNYNRLLELTPGQLSFEEWCRTTGPYLLPWKTLLLLQDQADETPTRGRATPGNSSPAGIASSGGGDGEGGQAPETHGFEQLARKFTSYFTPSLHSSLNLSQVADLLGWDLYEDVYPMVRHLIYYRKARVIDVPKPGHVYAISPLFDFARLAPLSHAWARAFPDMVPLPVFLSQLSSSLRPLSSLFTARHQRELALDVLIWLLRREVVVKMHVRLRLIATESVKRRTAERTKERHERHRARKEKKRQKAAKMEARRMRKSQSEEQKRRKAAEQAQRAQEQPLNTQGGSLEERGRSRERDRSVSRGPPAEGEQVKDPNDNVDGSGDVAQGGAETTSGLSVSRPPILAHPNNVAEAAAAAAAIAGTGRGERRPDSHEPGQHHHHHHHHHHHRHHHRRHQHANDPDTGTDSAAAAATAAAVAQKAPIPIAPRQKFDELKFERRPVLRSRSPSTALVPTGASTGLSVSFSNLSERSEIVRRARADTAGSSSSGGGLARNRTRGEGISMTPTTSQQSRPTTPNVAGRNIPLHVRDRSAGGGGSNASSSVEGGSVPRRARRATSSAGWGGRRGVARSRSPSRARMKVKGFGAGAEVEIDDGGEDAEDAEEEEVMAMDDEVKDGQASRQGAAESTELASKLDSLRLEAKSQMTKRRISTASERPDLPPPSESACSDEARDHTSQCGCSKHNSTSSSSSASSSSSSDDLSSSDLSLSSDLDSDSSASDSDRRPNRRSPPSSASISPASSPTHNHRFQRHPSSFSRTPSRPLPSSSTTSYQDSLIVEPARASRRENDYIATMVENKDAATTRLFFRLLPYLNGKHTIDEIELRVHMRRRDIRRLLKTFREYIITFMHP